jgi:quercetin 2,3-dioxygenase
MMQVRRSNERGYADHGWLKSYHSFSFANYHDPRYMGFGNLRVINEDWIAPGKGFGTHSHQDMEIITYVLSGELAHKDNMGNGEANSEVSGVVQPGDVQRMSAGTGVQHSEFNHAPDQTTHLLQIWIQPNQLGIAPGYEQKNFTPESKRGKLVLAASPDARNGSVRIYADALMYAGHFDHDESFDLPLNADRKMYVYLARGQLVVNNHLLQAGDALMLEAESLLQLRQGQAAEVIVFDLV